jgi:hypothetical protein
MANSGQLSCLVNDASSSHGGLADDAEDEHEQAADERRDQQRERREENATVLEVASHVFVPMAGSVLGEWGAEVIKVEDPESGDPYRGLATFGLHNVYRGVGPFFQSANRGKRSVAIDLKAPGGRRLLSRLAESADVFMTSLRSGARRRLRIDVDDVRRDNPSVIYVRGTAFGPRGPDAPDITNARLGDGGHDSGPPDRYQFWNPLWLTYRTADGRFVAFMMPALRREHFWRVCGGGDPDMPGVPGRAAASEGGGMAAGRGVGPPVGHVIGVGRVR